MYWYGVNGAIWSAVALHLYNVKHINMTEFSVN